MKEHTACWRKGEEILAKLLKEGKDTRGIAIEEKGKGEVWKREEICEPKKKEEGGSVMMVSNTYLQNPLTPKKARP